MSKQITLDLGIKTFEIMDADGNVTGTVRFNPSDPGFPGRLQQTEKIVDEYRQKISDMKSSGAPDIDQLMVLMEASDAIKNSFDYAFAAPVSQVFFGGNSVFAMTDNGRTLLENVTESVAPIIEDAIKTAVEKSKARMENHTSSYQGTTKGLAPDQVLQS